MHPSMRPGEGPLAMQTRKAWESGSKCDEGYTQHDILQTLFQKRQIDGPNLLVGKQDTSSTYVRWDSRDKTIPTDEG